jgi:tetratricopeptide (TPR) repeat protein
MAVNLTALFPKKSESENKSKSPMTFAYEDALHSFCGGELDAALEKITAALIEQAEENSGAEVFASYRLWIEILAQQNQKKQLQDLARHLFMRGQAEAQSYLTFVALRGQAHYEADEMQAASLLARTVSDEVQDPYCMELVQSVESRLSAPEYIPALARSTKPLMDYFHWQSLARGLLLAKEDAALAEALDYVSKAFKTTPLAATFEYHRCLDSELYAAAAIVATRLCELYPENLDYLYYHAYALFEDGDYPSARKILQHGIQQSGETDAEIVGLLGHCNAKLGEPEKAVYFLKRAISILQDEGLPTSHMRLELANVEEELRGYQLDPALEIPRDTRMWLIKLSPRRYHEMRVSSESTIDRLLRPMGNAPRQGDFCFFAGEAKTGKKGETQWKIAAIYTVDSEPMWHPVHKFHTALQLVARPPEGIPVAVQLMNEDTNSEELNTEAHHPFNYGVYELEMGALDIITETVRRRNEEMIGNGERRKDSRQTGKVG